MRKLILAATIAAVGLVFGTAGHAKGTTTKDSQAMQTLKKLKSDCKSDLKKYCNQVTPGEGRLAACLNSMEDKLSSSCKTTWLSTKERVSNRMDQADVQFRANCGTDVQKFCADVPSGKGRLLDCLSKHEDNLSDTCKSFQALIQDRVAELVG